MNLKQYRTARIIVAAVLGALIAVSIISQKFALAVAAFVLALLVLYALKRQVREVVEDERDLEVGGISARWAMTIFSLFAVVVTFFLLLFKDLNPYYVVIGSTLAYAVCFLMVVYSLIFQYHQIGSQKNKKAYLGAALAIALILGIAGIRLFSGEDSWMCQNGQWVQHGHPDFPAPAIECKK